MKQIFYFLLLILVSIQLSSCLDKTNYAQQLQAEKTLIADYIARNNIHVIDTLTVGVWAQNDYYLDKNGMYFHLDSIGNGTDNLEIFNKVVFRYIQYTLTTNPDSVSHWTSNEDPNPTTFIYGDGNYATICEAFHLAASYMKKDGAQAKIIVPSKIDFKEFKDAVVPMGYTIKMRFQK